MSPKRDCTAVVTAEANEIGYLPVNKPAGTRRGTCIGWLDSPVKDRAAGHSRPQRAGFQSSKERGISTDADDGDGSVDGDGTSCFDGGELDSLSSGCCVGEILHLQMLNCDRREFQYLQGDVGSELKDIVRDCQVGTATGWSCQTLAR
jgi:hypothetical protein